MSKSTSLAESQVTQTPHDVVTVELVQPDGMPAVVQISWPRRSRASSIRHGSATPRPRSYGCSARPTSRWPASKRDGTCHDRLAGPQVHDRGSDMTTTAAARTVLVWRWERATEWPLMIAAIVFLAAYAVPILDPDLRFRCLSCVDG